MWEFFCYSPTLHLAGVFSARSTQALLTSWDHFLDKVPDLQGVYMTCFIYWPLHTSDWQQVSLVFCWWTQALCLIKSCFSYSCQGSLFPWGRTGKKGISYKVLLLLCSLEGIPDITDLASRNQVLECGGVPDAAVLSSGEDGKFLQVGTSTVRFSKYWMCYIT